MDMIKDNNISDESLIKKEKNNKIFTMENLLCLFIIICPVLDISSFIFRNYFNTNISISTFIRPIIPIIAITYIFFKDKLKLQLIFIAAVYIIYSLCHMYIFNLLKTESSYGNEIRELQYLVNYTFMIMNLFIYIYFFIKKNRQKEIRDEEKGRTINKLKKVVLITLTIYITLMYLAIITKTSSFTYTEDKIGYKGWFESGNSIGTIMLLILFIITPMSSKKNNIIIRVWTIIILVLVALYLTVFLGTRTGLLGFVSVILLYVVISIIHGILHNRNVDKRIILIVILVFFAIGIALTIFGSKTIERRKQLREREDQIYDFMTEQPAHVTGDIVNLVKQIKEGSLSSDYMSETVQQTMLDLYNIANQKEVSYTNMRQLQFIYHSTLVKKQNSIPILLFGNGYMTHFYEMIFEMEVPAFLYNFGIVGFFIYFMPFFAISIYGVYILLKKYKDITIEFAMIVFGLCFAIMISALSGYTFFNSSTMMIIILLAILLIDGIKNIEDDEMKIYKK